MINILESIDRIASMGSPKPDSVSGVLGLALNKAESSPYWEAFSAEATGEILAASLKVGHDGSWLLFIHYEPTLAPQKGALDLGKYGPVVEIDVNPRVPPEGTESIGYNYRGLRLFFEFTTKTHLLRSVSMEK